MLPSFLRTGQIVGSAFVMLSSRIVPYDLSYEIDARMLMLLLDYDVSSNPFWLVAENLVTPYFQLATIPPIPLDTAAGPRPAYELIGTNGGAVRVLWSEIDPYCVVPVDAVETMLVKWNFDSSISSSFGTEQPQIFYQPSVASFTLEGMLGRNRQLVIGSKETCCLSISNHNLGFHIELFAYGTVCWDNYAQQIYLPVPLEQDKVPFKFTVFSGTNQDRKETLILMLGFKTEPIIVKLAGVTERIDPRYCCIQPLGTADLGECYLRMFGHLISEPHEVTIFVPTDLPFDPRRSECWDLQVSYLGSNFYKLSWTKDGALISNLIFGTLRDSLFGQAFLAHPVIEVSVTQTLEQTTIVQDASLRLMPRRYSDWAFEKWLFRPLFEFYASVDNRVLFLGYRSRISLQSEPGNIIRGEVSLMDNRALLQRMTIDKPVNYDYWMAIDAASDFLRRFGFVLGTVAITPNIKLLPEFVQERSYAATWRPRLGETALDFLTKIAEVAGWRLDFTQVGTIYALPRWEFVGRTWFLIWPEQSSMILSDIPVSHMNITIDDFQRRNILIVYGIDATTFADAIRVFVDLEAFVDFTSERFFPLTLPSFVRFDRPVPSQFMDRFGAWLAERLFVVPAEIEFQTPLNFLVRPGDKLRILNPTEADLHRYELVVTSVRHEIGRELTTFVGAKVYKQIAF